MNRRSPRLAFVAACLALLVPLACSAEPTKEEQDWHQTLRALSGLSDPVRTETDADPATGRLYSLATSEDSARLIVAQWNAAGRYEVEAATAVLPSVFGMRHYVEVLHTTAPGSFDVQVNSHDTCGIQVEHFKFAARQGTWRLVGYDRSEPDHADTCDVNLDSRRISANLLTGRVEIRDYARGRLVARHLHHRSAKAPALADFSFSIFEGKTP